MEEDRSPRLLWTDDGEPRSGRFGDVYFSHEDGLAESRAVFLAGCGLPAAWEGRRRFTVAELGFGTGLNIAALLELWAREKPAGGQLNIFTIEGFPLSRDEAERALSAWPELSTAAAALLAAWPDPTPGLHRMEIAGFDCTLDVFIGDVERALEQWSGTADAWFLDGFAPSANPQMWSEEVFDRVSALSAPGARLATFTVAGAVRRSLSARGFSVEKKPGHGRKRERLEGRKTGQASIVEKPNPTVAIIGAGIAGAALVRAFRALGVEPVLIEAEGSGAGASGFPAALVTPRLDVGDRDVALLNARALARAGQLYRGIPGAVIRQGVLKLEGAPRDVRRHLQVAAQDIWPTGSMSVLDSAECSQTLGESVATGGLFMRDALAIRPAVALDAWLGGVQQVRHAVASLRRDPGGWTTLDRAARPVHSAEVVVLAAGWGTAALRPDLNLSPVAGQADWTPEGGTVPAAWGGYAIPLDPGVLYGATHQRDETEPRVSEDASAANLAGLGTRLPTLARRLASQAALARTAVRATTPDRLPLAGPVETGLWVLGGLGSRGFCLAPLLAEHVAACVIGAQSPLSVGAAARLAPHRF